MPAMGTKFSTNMILLVVCSVMSFISARTLYLQSPSPSADDTYKLKYENLQKKIQQIHDVDFEEYVQLKEQKEKYLKADEILGKIFLVFLAEAGLKLSQKNIQQLRQQGVVLPKEPEKALLEAQEAPCKPTKGAAGALIKEDVDWLKNEKIFGADKLSEDEAKSLEIKDLFSVLKKAQPMGMGVAQKINGAFDGTITFEGPPFVWVMQLELEVTGENSSGVVEGKYKSVLSEPNKEPFSSSNGDGTQDQFLVTENSQAIFMKLKAKNKDNYIQVYITDGNRKLVGNFYEAVTLDQFKKTGTVSLTRR